MKNKTIIIRASLVKATFADCFSKGDIPKENKLFFAKDISTDSFKGRYVIGGNDMYYVKEVSQAIHRGELYKLTSDHSDSNFCFKLLLRPAEDYDLFYTSIHLKENKIYYVRTGDEVSGPYELSSRAEYNKVKTAVDSGILYVPCNHQTMEPITIRKSA